jgi:hypothetical protein
MTFGERPEITKQFSKSKPRSNGGGVTKRKPSKNNPFVKR